jgi:acetyl-CoA carboxylase biotin carboxyl carrier protein
MSEGQASSGDVFDLDRIRRLVELMKEHDLSEVDLQQEDQKIKLRRGAEGMVAAAPAPQQVFAQPAASSAPAAAAPVDDANIAVIKSPMVGTFFARPNPNSEPFVKVGDRVSVETTVCIVEAMKTFNEIPAEVSGVVVAVLVGDQEPVDHGRPLFKVDTSK